MSGITGLWNLDGRPIDPALVTAMAATLRHRGRDGEAHRLDRSAGFACQHQWVTPEEQGERQPLVGESGAMLVMDGRIDNRDELIDRLSAAGRRASPDASDARLVLDAYEAWREDFAGMLDGDFAVAIFDARNQRLVLARDAIGVRPLYYFHHERLFAFGSEIKALLAHPAIPAEPDSEGVADFLLVGSRPLDRQDVTCFKRIASVVAAHLVVVTPAHIFTRRYWDFDTRRSLHLKSFDEYVEAFRERFVQAVRRRTRSVFPVALSISGGLDSSSILCQIETLRRSTATMPAIVPVSYVSDRQDVDERHFLEQIEAEFGLQIDRIEIEPRTGLVRGAEEQVSAIEAPFVDSMWGITRELHTRAAAAGARTLLSGHWGDQMLFSPAYLIDLLRRGALPAIWRHTKQYARYFGDEEASIHRRRLVLEACRALVPRAIAPPLKWLRLRVFGRRPGKAWFSPAFLAPALKHRYRLATFDRPFHSAHARAMYIEARSKYQVQCMEWNNKVAALRGLDAAFPFLDRDLIAFLMAIPGEVHARDGVPRVLLREAMRGVLPEPIRTRTWKSDFSAFVNMGLSQDAHTILRTLQRDCLGVRFGFFDAERIAPELERVAAGLDTPGCINSWDLADTYGLEVWLRVFLGRSRGALPWPAA